MKRHTLAAISIIAFALGLCVGALGCAGRPAPARVAPTTVQDLPGKKSPQELAEWWKRENAAQEQRLAEAANAREAERARAASETQQQIQLEQERRRAAEVELELLRQRNHETELQNSTEQDDSA